MIYTKKLIIAAASVGAIGAAGIGASAIAATSDNGNTNYPPIVQKLASAFGLDPAKVNDVFKQQRQENQQDRRAHFKSVLDQAVKDGKLTPDQKTKLQNEIKTLHDQLKNQNETDRHQDMQDFRSQLQQWAKDNGINGLDQILPQPPAGLHHGIDNDGDADDTTTN